MSLTTDHKQMLAVRDGDLDELGALFEKYQGPLYNFFLRQTGSSQNSEDLVQDVFYRMLKYRHTYRAEGKFTTWMFSIAHSVKIEYYRKSRRRRELLDKADDQVSDVPTPEGLAEKANESEFIQRALSLLTEEKREVLLLSRFQNMKYEEIAEIVGVKVGTVKARVHWALKDLARIYGELTQGKA